MSVSRDFESIGNVSRGDVFPVWRSQDGVGTGRSLRVWASVIFGPRRGLSRGTMPRNARRTMRKGGSRNAGGPEAPGEHGREPLTSRPAGPARGRGAAAGGRRRGGGAASGRREPRPLRRHRGDCRPKNTVAYSRQFPARSGALRRAEPERAANNGERSGGRMRRHALRREGERRSTARRDGGSSAGRTRALCVTAGLVITSGARRTPRECTPAE